MYRRDVNETIGIKISLSIAKSVYIIVFEALLLLRINK